MPPLIQDLALILAVASAVGLLFNLFRLPVILGYIVAGVSIGSLHGLLPNVSDSAGIQAWADLGVIFLLFSLGLEFSFRKLLKLGSAAPITAIFEISCMMAFSYLIGGLLGFDKNSSLFLAGCLSISSTTVIYRTFKELNLEKSKFAQLTFGTLIMEDLLAVVLLVILAAQAQQTSLSGMDFGASIARLIFFLVLWLVLGLFFIPWLFKRIMNKINDEFLLIFTTGLCLMMVMIVTGSGYSAALGAFMMGSILAETSQIHRIEKSLVPIRNLFSAIFFVSIGLLLDVTQIWQNWSLILILSLVVILGKTLSVTLGALLAGSKMRDAVASGLSLAQIGEFSFIIALLGSRMGVTDDRLYAVVVAVSVITSSLTPFFLKLAPALTRWIEFIMPAGAQLALVDYQNSFGINGRSSKRSLLFRAYGYHIVMNTVLIIAIFLLVEKLGPRVFLSFFDSLRWLNYFLVILALIATSPFYIGLLFGSAKSTDFSAEDQQRLRRLDWGTKSVRWIFATLLTGTMMSHFLGLKGVGAIVLFLLFFGLVFVFRPSRQFYRLLEKIFHDNLTLASAHHVDHSDDHIKKNIINMAPWDLNLVPFLVSPASKATGKPLQFSGIKETCQVIVTAISRGDQWIIAPSGSEPIYPGDRLYCLGDEPALTAAKEYLEEKTEVDVSEVNFNLRKHQVFADSPLCNRKIRDSGLRERKRTLIVGIERGGLRYLNPDPELTIEEDDIVWLVGPNTDLISIA